jgi:hypothetical protein
MEQILIPTLIDMEKWDEAGWSETIFLHDPKGRNPPCLGLVFENIEAGKEIFDNLRKCMGPCDNFEELYVCFVEGEILGLEPGYTILISTDPRQTRSRLRAEGNDQEFRRAIIMSRCLRMQPALDSPVLANFKSEVRARGRYALIPMSSDMQPQFDWAIEKREVQFRQASDITGSDRDAVVFPENYFENKSIH